MLKSDQLIGVEGPNLKFKHVLDVLEFLFVSVTL
jgi:hypothetical protein